MAVARAVGVALAGIFLLLLFASWAGREGFASPAGLALLSVGLVACILLVLFVQAVARGRLVWPGAVGAAVGIVCLAAFTLFAVFSGAFMVADGFNGWESRDKFLMRHVMTAQMVLEWFQEAEGRYPTDVSEDAGVQMQVDRIKEDCAGLGHEIAEVRLLGGEAMGDEERSELLVASDPDGKPLVVIYSDGTYGLSRSLLTRRARAVPEQVEILR